MPTREAPSFLTIALLDTDPLIWREVEVPTSITLKALHDIVQITMGWLDDHLWEFTIGKSQSIWKSGTRGRSMNFHSRSPSADG